MANQYPTVDSVIANLEVLIKNYRRPISIRSVCNELSIFDWWPENLNLNHMKQMVIITVVFSQPRLFLRMVLYTSIMAQGTKLSAWPHVTKTNFLNI